MRLAVFFVLLLIVESTSFVYAAEPRCLKSGQSITVSSKDAMKGQASRQVSCTDLCSDEEVTLTINRNMFNFPTGATVSMRTVRECKTDADKKRYGCKDGQIKPRVTIITKNEGTSRVTLSKCDKAKLAKAFGDSIDTQSTSPLAALAEEQKTELERTTLTDITSTDTGKQQLTENLRNAGVMNAEELVKNNPSQATELLRAMTEGDKEKAQEIARELKLNNDVVSNVGRMAEQQKTETEEATDTPSPERTTQTTTFTEQQQTPSEIERAKYAICSIESSCNYYKLGPVTRRGDRAYGKYQVMGVNVLQWTCEVGQCMTPQQFLYSPEMQERVFENKFGQYAARYGYVGAAKAWFGGPGALSDPYRRDQLGTSVAAYASKFAWYFNGTVPSPDSYNRYIPSRVADTTYGYTYENPPTPTSPFAVGNPYGSSVGTPTTAGTPIQTPQQQSYVPNQTTSYTSGNPGGVSTNVQPQTISTSNLGQTPVGTYLPTITTATFKPVLSISTQKTTIEKGKPITLLWTSVGTAYQNVFCSVKQMYPDGKQALLSQDREGSRIIKTNSLLRGVHTFTFECRVSGGESVRKETKVTIQ